MTFSIVILTGAGISAESGIQTFRRADGLWEGHQVEDVATPEGFARDPELVQRSYLSVGGGRGRLRRIWCFRAWLTSFLRWALDPDEK